mgnify:FL=1
MLSSFLQFVLDVFGGIIELLQYTEFGGFTLENVLVAILIVTIVARTVIVKFGE